jgi:hypothetical protein
MVLAWHLTQMTRIQQSGPRIARFRRRAVGTFLLVASAFFILIALSVFLTQGSQIRVTATALSETCHYQFDLGSPAASGQRCNAPVIFTTRSGQIIRTTITDAFPSEFSHHPGRPTTIQLRYDSSDPTQPYKQSNVMSAGVFAMLLGIGAVLAGLGLWVIVGRRATRA